MIFQDIRHGIHNASGDYSIEVNEEGNKICLYLPGVRYVTLYDDDLADLDLSLEGILDSIVCKFKQGSGYVSILEILNID